MDPLRQPVIEIRATFANGEQESRSWCMDESPPKAQPPQPWMIEPHRIWDRPRDPVVLSFRVDAEHEQVARDWLASL